MLKCTTVCKRVRKLIIHFVFKWTSTIYSRLNFNQTCWKNKQMGSCFRTYHHQQGPLFSSMACFGVFYSQIVFHELSPSKRVWVRLWTLGPPKLVSVGDWEKRCTLSWWFTGIQYNYTTIIYWYWIHPPHFYVPHSKRALPSMFSSNEPRKAQGLFPSHEHWSLPTTKAKCVAATETQWFSEIFRINLIPSKSRKTCAAPWLPRSRGVYK